MIRKKCLNNMSGFQAQESFAAAEKETLNVVRRSLIDLADFEDALKNLGSALSEEVSISLESFFFIEPCSWYSNIPGGMFSLGYSIGSLSTNQRYSFKEAIYSVVK